MRKSILHGSKKTPRLLALLLILVLVGGVLAACGGEAAPEVDLGTTTEESADDATADDAAAEDEGDDEAMAEDDADESAGESMADMSAMEAPSLAEMVAAGDLPPLEERLPTNPAIVEPVESLGQYGGTWRSALVGGADNAWLVRTISYEHMVRWNPEFTGLEPNIAESFEANDEATEFTFYLREGMKWSDGDDFNADDVMFWYEATRADEDYEAVHPTANWIKGGDGEGVVVERIDDYTVKFVFSAPNGLFLQNFATPSGADVTRYPAHYCSQFHAAYADADELDALIAEHDATDWVNLFDLKCGGVPGTPYDARWQNAELPTLMAWDIVDAYGEGTQVIAERNPYYWKTDPEGRQLPYIDTVIYDILEDTEVLLGKVASGEIDMMSRHFNTNDNKAFLFDEQENGEFEFFETIEGGNTTGFHFNLNHQDPRMREIFQNKNFRIAMSHCINRQEIVDLLYIGQGEPMASAVGKEMPDLYDEEFYTQYIEFDQELAQELLESEGFVRDGDYYLAPDGEPLSFEVQVTEAFGFDARAEVVVNQWQACGIDARLKVMDRSLLYTRKDANEHDVHVWGAGAGPTVFLDPRHLFPYSGESTFAQAWQTWYNNPDGDGALTPPEEPPADVQRQMELYDQIKASGDTAVQTELMKEIIEIAKDQFYVIGLSSSPPGYGIVKTNFRNVPESMPGSWQYPTPAPTHPEQYWIEQ